jgi:hypothetical protein
MGSTMADLKTVSDQEGMNNITGELERKNIFYNLYKYMTN